MPQLTIQQSFDLALQHHLAGRLTEAEQLYWHILARQPNHADALHLLGVIAHQVGRNDAAVDLIQRSLALRPDFAGAYCNLGVALYDMGKPDEAIAAHRRAIVLKPDYPEAHNNLGDALGSKGQLDESIAACRRAIALRPNFPEAYSNLGNTLKSKGELDDAIEAHRRAISLRPDYPEAHSNLGNALMEKGQWDESIAAHRRAIELRADFPEAHHNLSLALLLQGDFQQGWEEYEWRWKCKEFRAITWNCPQPRWDGSDLANRTILIQAEQGLGDTIQFIRYVPLVAARGGTVIFAGEEPLSRLLQHTPGISRWCVPGGPPPPFDVYCPLLSLSRAFGTARESIPNKRQYLSADPALSQSWQTRLAEVPPALRVAVVWAGNSHHKRDRQRSMNLASLSPLMHLPGARFFSLQKGEAAAQVTTLATGLELIDWTSELNDFADTAALIDNLDLVISVDTAAAHLAGAMGKPVWLMLPFAPDWRWGLDRSDSPWYPTMRLFRQPARGDWESVIAEIADALSLWIKEHTSRCVNARGA